MYKNLRCLDCEGKGVVEIFDYMDCMKNAVYKEVTCYSCMGEGYLLFSYSRCGLCTVCKFWQCEKWDIYEGNQKRGIK